jgi:ribonuclease HI
MSTKVSSEDLAEVVRAELRLLDPEARADSALVGRLLHPDFVEIGASGQVYRRETVMELLANDPRVQGAAHDFVPSPLADGVVLLTYRVAGARNSLRSSIWIRSEPGEQWQLRFHQGTLRPETGPGDGQNPDG